MTIRRMGMVMWISVDVIRMGKSMSRIGNPGRKKKMKVTDALP